MSVAWHVNVVMSRLTRQLSVQVLAAPEHAEVPAAFVRPTPPPLPPWLGDCR